MNPQMIIAVLTLLETLATQIAGAVSAIQSAQNSGVDLTPAQVAGYQTAANAALATLQADIAAAQAAAPPPPSPPASA